MLYSLLNMLNTVKYTEKIWPNISKSTPGESTQYYTAPPKARIAFETFISEKKCQSTLQVYNISVPMYTYSLGVVSGSKQ